ncbi:hypothetical protein K449DRAFT_427206 [Hypoxylon sp. EC38]|nr:hypothetical protein K449DRAFT_427206 [Hypoxylon sp. EC38]
MSSFGVTNTRVFAQELHARAFTPPALESLNFSSNCTLVGNFYEAWFSELKEDGDHTDEHGPYNITYWVPSSLPADLIEEYFRAALPGDVREQATYAEILSWENDLRKNYSGAVESFRQQSQTDTERVPTSAQLFPYFEFAVARPGLVCRDEACSQAFEWALLPDINGPGATASWYIQAIMISLFSAIVAWERFFGKDLGDPPRKSFPWSLYKLVKRSMRGLQEVAQLFILALFIMLLPTSLNEALQRKHLMIVFYVELFMTSVSVWLSLLARCVRRVDERHRTHGKLAGVDHDIGEQPLLNRPLGSTWKGLSSQMISLMTPLIGFIITGIIYRGTSSHSDEGEYQFEVFQDGLCGFRSSENIQLGLFIACCVTAGVSFFRATVPIFIRDNIESLDYFTENESYQRLANYLDFAEMFILMVISLAVLGDYQQFNNRLLVHADSEEQKKAFNVGQALAVAAMIPVVGRFLLLCVSHWLSRKVL